MEKKAGFMDSLEKRITSLTTLIAMFLFVVLSLLTFLQVIMRYVLRNPPYWTEEVARFLYIWLVFIGFSIVVHRDSEMRLPFIVEQLNKKVSLPIDIINNLSVIAFIVIGIVNGIFLSFQSKNVLSTALRIPWAYIYISLPVGFVFLLLLYLVKTVSSIQDFAHSLKKNQTNEETGSI